MTHYWTAAKIVERCGWSRGSAGKIKELIKRHAVPAFLRVDRHNKFKRTYYMSEGAAIAWELSNARAYRERLKAEEVEKQNKR
jgi:hypothetical protein